MLRIAGGVLIVLAGGSAGFYFSGRLALRAGSLEAFLAAISAISEEIRWERPLLGKLIRQLAENESFKKLGIFAQASDKFEQGGCTDFAGAFEWALKKNGASLALKNEDMDIIAAFGRGLGMTDAQGQAEHCRHYYERVASQLKAATEHSAKMGRLYRTLGTLGGALVVMLLI